MKTRSLATHFWLVACTSTLMALGGCDAGAHGEEGDRADAAGQAPAKGPHGGRQLEQEGFGLEVTIYERGVPPEFRLYPTLQGKPVPPGEVSARIELHRVNGLPGGEVDEHRFVAREDYLASPTEVHEPHSFEVKVQAEHGGSRHEWSYDSPEGRVTIGAAAAAAQGVATAEAGPGVVTEQLTLYGRIQPNAERLRSVGARFAGVVQSVAVQVGDSVRAGQPLARVESNESLRSYAVTAPISGTVVRRNVNPGEATGGGPLFEVADFGSVWAEFAVFPRDRARLRTGQRVEVRPADGEGAASGRIRYVSPIGTAGPSLVARVELDNAQGQWTPGQFVNGRAGVAETSVPLVVPLSALQRFRDWDVVAVNEGERYQLLPVETGQRDGEVVEIRDGLSPGARVVTANSYLIKADVEKSGASHDH